MRHLLSIFVCCFLWNIVSAEDCVYDSDGVYPNCVCRNPGSGYVKALNWCQSCPEERISGTWPDCVCEYPSQYNVENNRCESCPDDTTGIFPDCKCNDERLEWNRNTCFTECPDNKGFYPWCLCDDGYSYDRDELVCKDTTDRMCPEDAVRIGPNCACLNIYKSHFNPILWKCEELQPSQDYEPPSPDGCTTVNDKPHCSYQLARSCLLSCIGR